jgi:MFS family permease
LINPIVILFDVIQIQTMAHARKKSSPGLARFRWVIGTPYFVQGTSTLTEIPILYFIKFTLGMGDAGGQLFDALRQTGWFIKPVWGLISDRVSIFGYHRKSWYILMAVLAVVFWMINALLASIGITLPIVYLVSFNLAFATYAFVDVVCDAIMVTHGRKLDRVGSFINFQWAVLAVANALSVYLGGWLQGQIQKDIYEPWVVFMLTGIPPLVTAAVGIRNIEEERCTQNKQPRQRCGSDRRDLGADVRHALELLRRLPAAFGEFRRKNRPLWLLVLFIFFWKFSPSIGFIERSYLIDVRGFTPESFGLILSIGGVTFLASVLAYGWIVRRFPGIEWYRYLYAMVALGVVTFPLSFYLYFDSGHPWWALFDITLPDWLNPLPQWNRYQWFRLIVQTTLGFATIPAFIIPLTVAGETINVAYAGVGYAFLMSLSNATNMFEGVVGAGLYHLFSQPVFDRLVGAFGNSFLNLAGTRDERTLILQIFVYISLFFTLLTIPFIEMLRRELARNKIDINLGKRN